MLCDYGCGQEALYTLRNGKKCCCKSCNSCPGMKKKNSEGLIKFIELTGLKPKGNRTLKRNSNTQKGKTYEELYGEERAKLMKEKMSKKRLEKYFDGRGATPEREEERKRKISETMKKNKKSGGRRDGSGRGVKSWYESPIAGRVFLDSSWELAYAKYLDENNIKWKRNWIKFPYHVDETVHYYIPDFFLIDENCFVEIKGYKTDRDDLKWKEFPYVLKVLMFKELTDLGIYVKK